MKKLPDHVLSYAKSPEFTEESIPENLLKSHRTNAQTWAKIIILEGKLRYRIFDDGIEEINLSPDRPGIVEPEMPHQVEAIGSVSFFLEFYR